MHVNSLFVALALGALAISASAPVLAQTNDSDEIVVTGQRLRQVLRDFVGQVAAPIAGENQVARWDNHICPLVVGLTDRSHEQFIADRIATHAHEVGLRPEGAGCRANILVFLTPDADELAQTLLHDYGQLLAVDRGMTSGTMGQSGLASFSQSNQPVRWWLVAHTRSADGYHVAEPHAEMQGGDRAVTVGVVHYFGSLRLHRATRQDLGAAIVIVDSRRAAGYRLDTLADYISMVSLAQLDPSADTSAFPTILNVFSSTNAPISMTDWDRAYLNGLYHVERNSLSARRQESQITDRMLTRLDPQTPAH